MQLLPAAEGIMPSGQGRQKGEAAVAKEPTGHGVQPEEGRPLKPRMTIERTMARSLGAWASIRQRCRGIKGEGCLHGLRVGQLQRRLPMKSEFEELHA